MTAGPLRYLALGDSYTIGTGASSEVHNYPSILAARLTATAGRKVEVTNPAVNGFTTSNLIDNELGYLATLKPDLVSLLIGVNDLVQGRTPEEYRKALVRIDDDIAALGLGAGRVVAISIPNWSATPAAATFGDPAQLRGLTETFNRISLREAEARGFTWVDITSASTSGSVTRGWISSDQLHPGDAQYAAWAEVIWESVREAWAEAARS
jgi:lysophospholipase L1-like esterase